MFLNQGPLLEQFRQTVAHRRKASGIAWTTARKKKKNAAGKGCVLRVSGASVDLDDLDAAVGFVVFDGAVLEREERPITTHADIASGMNLGAALADEDVASDHCLTAELLNAEPL